MSDAGRCRFEAALLFADFLAASTTFGEKSIQNGVVHRLHQMGVKARFVGAPAVFFLTPSRQCD